MIFAHVTYWIIVLVILVNLWEFINSLFRKSVKPDWEKIIKIVFLLIMLIAVKTFINIF